MPGDNVELIGDLVHDVAMEVGSRFTLREGGKTSKSWVPCQQMSEYSNLHYF